MTTPEQGKPTGRKRKPPLLELVVDPEDHADEIERFRDKVVVPPTAANGTPSPMCSLWRGAVGDDGYGRFSITRGGHEYTVKPHRYAVAWKLGIAVAYGQVIEHIDCDNPLCCYADPDPVLGHIWPSTQAENLRRMAHKGRGGGSGWWRRKWSGLNRRERAERSNQLRNAVKNGWDEARVKEVLMRIDPAQTALFTV
ncbi:hypothetical protein JNUCC0626_49760 (plasmid) [Lentzea sp. JNUCC 0626]|uniref:hypothetical protein n=1 Tax=Lentzea sp. JNUCC 0626 TaxID=3367513 RepID=UPI00374A20FB